MLVMHNQLDLMRRHTGALFTTNTSGQMLTINEPWGGGPAPRLFLGRTERGNIWSVRSDLAVSLVAELAALCRAEPIGVALQSPPRHIDTYIRLLEAHAPVSQVWTGPAYHFAHVQRPSRSLLTITETNAACLQRGFEELIPEVRAWQPFLGLVEENRVVSVCRSARITSVAHEAGVETLADFRGKGYAKEVVAGWARLVQSMGAMPLYSTSWENHASQAVAKKLNLLQFGADFHIT